MSDCGHGWRNENDCDVCRPPAIVVAGLRGRISDLERTIEKTKAWARLQIAHPGCKPDAKALLDMLNNED